MLRILTLAFLLSVNNKFLLLNSVYARTSSLPSPSDSALVDKPFFVDNPQNITALNGESVTLKCTVKEKGNRTVSWIRKRDLAILTSNTFVYTSDARFGVVHISDADNFDLRIARITEKDQGLYECQINTEPKINFPIFLEVLNDTESVNEGNLKAANKFDGKVPRVKILSPSSSLEIAKGSTIFLTCTVNLQASLILWYHNDTLVDFQRGGMNLENEKTSEGTTSRLLLTKANFRDSGVYSCSAHISTSQSSDSSTQLVPMILPDSISVRVVER